MKKNDGVQEVKPQVIKKVSNPRGSRERRIRAKERLEAQLVSKTKILRNHPLSEEVSIPLTEGDIKRIKKEIEILKTRII